MDSYMAVIEEIKAMKNKDMAAGVRWVNPKGQEMFRDPKYEYDMTEFVNDWIGTCPKGTEKTLKEVEKHVRKTAKNKGYVLEEWHVDLIKARKLAVIKRNYIQNQLDVLMKVLKENNIPEGHGHTYMAQIVQIMNNFISKTSSKCPALIARYENNPSRRKV